MRSFFEALDRFRARPWMILEGTDGASVSRPSIENPQFIVIAVAGVVAIGSALAAESYALGIVGAAFILVAAVLGYVGWRARRSAGGSDDAGGTSRSG